MGRIDEISVEELQKAMEGTDGKKATQRLLAAIAYKNGITQSELAEWYDVERKTIYNWLTRLNEAPLEEAVVDNQRSGRKRKLTEDELEDFRHTVRGPPREAGYDEPAWTTTLVRRHLAEAYDVEYSLSSCRRLLREAGLRFVRSRSPNANADRQAFDRSDEPIDDRAGRWVPA